MRLKGIVLWVFVLVKINLFGQHYTHQLPLNKVWQAGWYKVELPPKFIAVSSANFNDTRLLQTWYSDSIIQVPYFVEQIKSIDDSVWFEKLLLNRTNKYTYLIQQPFQFLESMQLKVNNHADRFLFSLAGSMDGKEWYSIDSRLELAPLNSPQKPFDFMEIQFPRSAYPYLRLQFLDSLSTPIQIIEAGVLRNKEQPSALRKLAQTDYQIIELPQEKITRIKIFSPYKQVLDKLVFDISSPTYFKRHVEVYRNVTNTVKGKKKMVRESLTQFELNSQKETSLYESIALIDTLFLDIYNEDNPALKINQVGLFRYPIFLYAYLEKNSEPILYTGNKQLPLPNYDIGNFSYEKIHAKILMPKELQVIPMEQLNAEDLNNYFNPRFFMWVCLGIGILVLFWFAKQMLPKGKD